MANIPITLQTDSIVVVAKTGAQIILIKDSGELEYLQHDFINFIFIGGQFPVTVKCGNVQADNTLDFLCSDSMPFCHSDSGLL